VAEWSSWWCRRRNYLGIVRPLRLQTCSRIAPRVALPAISAVFCVSALRLDPREAARALRAFRRRTGWKGEVKGHSLTVEQRLLLLDLAFKTPGAAAVVVCDSRTAFGGWAANTIVPEACLRRELLFEACVLAMEDIPGIPCAGVTVDDGRYTRNVLAEERAHVEAALRQRGLLPAGDRPRLVAHEASEQHPGLQVADVVANVVHRFLRDADGLPDALVERLHVRHVGVPSLRPGWAGEPPY